MNSNNRVFITGLGSISTYGVGVGALWKAANTGTSTYKKIPESWLNSSAFNGDIYLNLEEIDYTKFGISRAEQLLYDPSLLNLFIAISESIKSANIKIDLFNEKKNLFQLLDFDPYKLGVFIGSGNGGIKSLLNNYRYLLLNKYIKETENQSLKKLVKLPPFINKFVAAQQMPNAVSDGVGIKFCVKGEVNSTYYACASSTIALGNAFNSIRNGSLDCAIAGGTEYASDHLGVFFKSFDLAGVIAKEVEGTYRGPFDSRSNGFLFSEGGSGSLILESEQSMNKRGVEPYAEITGYARTFDAHNIMSPPEHGDELKRLYLQLLKEAKLKPEDVDYINAHGTGTRNDIIEVNVLNQIFPRKPVVTSSKGVIGHTLGASGSLETIITALSIKNNVIPPSGSLYEPITSLNLATKRIDTTIQNSIVASSSFGGHNAALMLSAV